MARAITNCELIQAPPPRGETRLVSSRFFFFSTEIADHSFYIFDGLRATTHRRLCPEPAVFLGKGRCAFKIVES